VAPIVIERRSVVHQVAEQLRDAVVGALMNSTQLPSEAVMARELMVSRPTLREGLRILEAEGLLQRDPRTSALHADAGAVAMSRPLRSALNVLTRTEQITLEEIMDLRMTIEGRAAERAAEVASDEEIEGLEADLEVMREPGITSEDWRERTLAFRIGIVKASHNEAFLLIMLAAREAAADIVERAAESVRQRRTVPAPTDSEDITPADRRWIDSQYEFHRRIYEAIRDGRGVDARERCWNGPKGTSHFELLLPDT
jgi:GntR family transcriptional regulator, transcriptional repressor for pyruvate dehydrogenase complex